KLGSYREALGGIHLPALNLRFKGYTSGRYSGEQFNYEKAIVSNNGGFFYLRIGDTDPSDSL
ncbi:hypothetical protein ACS8FA_14110, partial [Psychrobacter sp. 1Y1]|uniref:hypothetical protein n=1 Tax=Psychrobacter sp. 1Y1 TaxID=3453574 RepID=UPI003F466AED